MIARLSWAGVALPALVAGDDRLATVVRLFLLEARGQLLLQGQRLKHVAIQRARRLAVHVGEQAPKLP